MKGYVVVHLDENVITDNVYTTFNTNYITLVMVMLLSLSFIALYFVQIHKPLNGIIKATKEYGKGNLAYKIDVKNDIDEIGRLSASLNYMASKLDESDQFQQKFLSNISHDFRSPLTSIKGYLEAIADGTIPPEMTKIYWYCTVWNGPADEADKQHFNAEWIRPENRAAWIVRIWCQFDYQAHDWNLWGNV